MKNVKAVTFWMLYIILVAFEAIIICVGSYFVPMHVLVMIPICLIINFPLAYIILKASLKKESKDPYARLNSEFMREMKANGFNDRTLAMAEQAVNEFRSGAKINFIYLKDFLIFTADYYNLMGDYGKASEYLAMVDENAIAGQDIMFIDNGYTVLTYYMTKMETLRGLGDAQKARDLIGISKAVLGNRKRTDIHTVMLDHIEYMGWMTLGELGKAGEAAERLLNNNSSFAKNLCSVYFFNADYQLNMGNRDKALEYMEMGRQLIQAKTPSLMFYYEGTMKKLGLS